MTLTGLPANRLRCSGCKSYRKVTDYPLRDDGYRLSTCRTCQNRKREQYREKKGEFIQGRHDRRVRREQTARVQRQKQGIWTLEERASWEVTRKEQEEEGQRWAKLSDDELQWYREERQWEIEQDRQWDEIDIFTDKIPTDLEPQLHPQLHLQLHTQKMYEGWQTAGELWETQQPIIEPIQVVETITDPALTDDSYESFTDDDTDRYCSSCAQIRPPSAFGRFFTCNICRKRKAPSNQARNARRKIQAKESRASQPRPTNLRELLRTWSDLTGEQGLRERHQIKRYGRIKFPEEVLRRPLVVDDYIGNNT
ncbi:hypothetical protein DL98DRAFT_523024 [Cadophora sp. DSE1049]|nr:hypothetical protein DL98DRAFT_523024 [Cadophora sp. DSE1049]